MILTLDTHKINVREFLLWFYAELRQWRIKCVYPGVYGTSAWASADFDTILPINPN